MTNPIMAVIDWIDENGDYLGFDTEEEANDYIKETFK